MPISISIVMSNHIICEGLQRLLDDDVFNITFTYTDYSTFPDIVLFDSGQDIQTIIDFNPEAKLLILDMGLKEYDLTQLLLCYRINGVIAPETSVKSFKKALQVVYNGEIWIDQKHLTSLLHSSSPLSSNGQINGLSHQDKVIIQLITQGDKNKDIADKLCLSEHTIKAHVSRIYKKFNIHNRSQLVCLAMEYGVNR